MTIFRPRLARPVTIALVALAVLVSTIHVSTSGLREASFTLALGLAMAAYGVIAYTWPAVIVRDEAIEVRNVLSTVTVPLARIAYVDTRWALEIYVDGGRKVSAFAAPAPGAWTARQTSSADLKGLHPDSYVGGGARIGDKPGTDSGTAAAMVREALSTWRDAHGYALPDDSTPPVMRTVNVRTLVVVAVVLAAFMAAVTI